MKKFFIILSVFVFVVFSNILFSGSLGRNQQNTLLNLSYGYNCTHPVEYLSYGSYNGWHADEFGHYLICQKCKQHVDSPNYKAGSHNWNSKGTCTICTHKKSASTENNCTHINLSWGPYNGWQANESQHYLICLDCKQHIGSPKYPNLPLEHDSNAKGSCTICTYTKKSTFDNVTEKMQNIVSDLTQWPLKNPDSNSESNKSNPDDVILDKSELTVDELAVVIDDILHSKRADNDMFDEGDNYSKQQAQEYAEIFIKAEEHAGVNALVLAAISTAESSLGSTYYYDEYGNKIYTPTVTKNNFMGVVTEGKGILPFEDKQDCANTAAERIYWELTGDTSVSSELEFVNKTLQQIFGINYEGTSENLYSIGKYYNTEDPTGYAQKLDRYYKEFYNSAKKHGFY